MYMYYLTRGDVKVVVGIVIKAHYSQPAVAFFITTHPCFIALSSAAIVPLEVPQS